MPGLTDLLRNPRRLQQFAETPGNYPAALEAASRMDERAYATAQERQRTASLRERAKQAKDQAKIIEGMTLETGDVMDRVQLPSGEVAPIDTPSGKVVKVPGKSNLFVDPSTGEPYQADPTKPTGLRSAYDTARRVARGGKEYAVIPGVGEREIGPDQKAIEKRQAENTRLSYALEKRPYNIDRVTGQPIPLQSDEEWAKQKQEKADKLAREAHVKNLKRQADLLDLDAKTISINTPKVSSDETAAYDAAVTSLEAFAGGKDLDTAAKELSNAPDSEDEEQNVAKATAQSYLSLRDKVKPAKDAEAKVKELELRSIDLKRQMLDPDAWKADKTASLAQMPDADLVAEAKAQADIITDQETEAQGVIENVNKGRASLEQQHAAFLAERQAAEAQGLSLEQQQALDTQQAQLEAEMADYDDYNAEAVASAQGSIKASQDRREVLAAAGAEIDRRNKSVQEQAQAAKEKAAVLTKAKPLYDWAKDNFHYTDDYRGMNDYGILDAEAKKAGLDPKQAREALQTYRQLDWSNAHIDTTTGKPLDEKARLLPDGNITVNPGLLLDPEAYNAAVDAAETTPEAKARAKAMRAELAAPVAAKAIANLRKNSDFAEWLDKNTTGNDTERMEQFNASMKEGGAINASLMKFLGSAAGLPSGWLGAIAGLTGSDAALEYARYWQDRAQAYQTAAGEAGKGTNMAGRFLASVAGGVPSVLESLAVGGAAGRVIRSGAVALGASAIDAAAQSGGGTFVDAVDAYMKQGLSQEEAKAKAAVPAIASGLVTGVLTALGSGGVESLLRPEGQALGRAAIKKSIKAKIGEGVSDEAAEEWADQMMQGIIAQLTYDPKKPIEQVFAEATEAGLVGGVLGGGSTGIQAFLDRNAPEVPAQPQAPAGPGPVPGPVAPGQIRQPAKTGDVSDVIKAFTPTGEALLPQAVADTAKRTNRTTADVARAAASGLVKVAEGASLESLDAREREALGFISKDGKIVPASNTTPLVDTYKGKLVIRNEAAEWLDEEGQPLLARRIKLDEAERKAQIDAAEAKPAAKKKAGQPAGKTAQSKQQGGETAITGGSLPPEAGSTPAPATISGATEAPKPSQTITGSNAGTAAEMPVQPATAGEASAASTTSLSGQPGALSEAGIKARSTEDLENEIPRLKKMVNDAMTGGEPDTELAGMAQNALDSVRAEIARRKAATITTPAPTNEPKPQAAVSPEPSRGQVVPESRGMPVVPEQPPAPAQEAAPEPEPAADGGLTPTQQDQLARAEADHKKRVETINKMESDPEQRSKQLKAEGMRHAAVKRRITGKLTDKEQAAQDKREASNYEGKPVAVEGRPAVVIGNRFGLVKVRFEDGTTKVVTANQVEARPEAAPATATKTEQQAPSEPQEPETPLAKARAAIADYTAKAQAEKAAAKTPEAKNAANRKLVGAEWLAKRLEAFDGVVDFVVDSQYKGVPVPGMMIASDGVFVINPAGIVNQIASNRLDAKGVQKAVDKFLVHEFIHKAALSRISGKRIIELYNALTPEAKEASRRLYLAQTKSGKVSLNEFQAAHEWFAQLIEARMSGEISNQALIEASNNPDFRDKLASLFREFVAALREIAGLVKDPAMAAQIRAEADAVEAIVRQMTEGTGLIESRAPAQAQPVTKPVTQAAVAEPGLDDADKALADAFSGLYSPPETGLANPPAASLQQTDLPRDRRDAMMKAASVLVDAGVKTPAELAARLDKLAPGGQLRQYSRAFWRLMTGFDSTLEESPDWQTVFAAVDSAKAGPPAEAAPETPADPNIGREWDSVYGRQRIVSRDDRGLGSYLAQTVGTDTVRHYSIQTIDDEIRRQEYALTPEYAAEQEERKARAERQAQAEKAQEEAKAKAAEQVNAYFDDIGLNPMQRGKLKAALDQFAARRSSGTGKEYSGPRYTVTEQMVADGFQPQTEQVPAMKELSGTQWNRMDNRQQQEFERKRKAAGMKTEYRLALPDGSMFEVTKAEHDYAKWLAANAGLELGRAEGRQAEPSGDTERIKRAKWRELGGRVSIALPANASRMKPQPKDIAAAAEQLGINNADAALAWNIFTNDDAATPKRPAPTPPAKAGLQVKAEEAGQAVSQPGQAEPSQPAAEQADPTLWADVSRFFASMNSDSMRAAAIKDLKNGTATEDSNGYLIDLLENPNWTGNARSIAPKLIARLKATMGQPAAQAQPEPSPAQAVPTAGEAEAPVLPPAEPYASPLAQFVGEWLGMNASQQSRADMPQRVIRLADNQADTEAVMALVKETSAKGADGEPLFNTPHQRLYNELREMLRFMQRKNTGTEKGKVSTQLTAVPTADEAPALPPTQAAAVAKEEAMPEPAKQAAPFDAAAAKGQKKFLLAEVAQLIKDAPRLSEMTQEQKNVWNDLKDLTERQSGDMSKSAAQELRNDIASAKARAQRLIGYVTIEIPGDGTFTILNEKGALAQFHKRADKFPVSQYKDDLPAKPTAQAPTAVPALKKPKTTADVVAAIYPMVSQDQTRGNITSVKGDGTHLFATDGRVLARVEQENGGGKGTEAVIYDEKGNANPWPEGEGVYDANQVIPDDSNFQAFEIDAGRWFSLMSQARAMVKTLPGEDENIYASVSIYRNSDGSLGVFASDVNRGDYAHNIQPEAKFLAAYNPAYIQTILRAARNLGHETVEFRVQDDVSPTTFRAPNAVFVLMPMRINGAAAYSPEAKKARTVPPVTAQPAAVEAASQPIEPSQEPVTLVAEPAPKRQSKAKPAKEETGIADFGEKLGGARKDKAATINEELTNEEIAGKTLSEIWPKSEIDSIEDDELAAYATALRDAIPTKPQKGYKLNVWVGKVKMVKELMRFAAEKGVPEMISMLRSSKYNLNGFADKIALLQSIPRKHWSRIGNVRNYPDAYRFEEVDGNMTRIPSPSAEAEVDGRRVQATNLNTLAEAVNAKVSEGKSMPKMQFEVRGKAGKWGINKKGDPLYRKLKIFENPKEALAYINSNYADLVAAWEDVKESDNVKETDLRKSENRPRTAEDWRKGKDATPEMFANAFGFRGVEFGNWVSQGKNAKERQGMMNEAYDALHDLASILNIPTKAISLNGKIGLGFGSRGQGWASAHYEPGNLVINLTKTRGAGSLAHELFHAFDHHFGSARGRSIKNNAGVYITNEPETRYVNEKTGHTLSVKRWNEIKEAKGRIYDEASYKLQKGVRPEVEEAFTELVKALDDSPMTKRARLNDKGKKDYWGSTIERAARSFENYVIYKMQQKGYQNDYLANVVTIEDFVRNPNRYPYLLDEEIEPVAKAFDDLFATIKTRETETGVELYNPPGEEATGLVNVGEAIDKDLVEKTKKAVKAGRTVGTSNPTTAKRTGQGTDSDHNVELDRLRQNNPLAYRQNALILTRYPVVAKNHRDLYDAMAKADAPVKAAAEEIKQATARVASAQNAIRNYVAKINGLKAKDVKANAVNAFVATNFRSKVVKDKQAAELALSKARIKAKKASETQTEAIEKILSGKAISEEKAKQVYEDYITAVETNLLTLIELFPQRLRDVARLWYDGANIIAQKFSKQYGATLEQASGVLAVFSPQKDWFMNVSLAQRMMNIWANDQDTVWSPEMTKQFIKRSGEPQPVETKKKGEDVVTISTRESLISEANPEGIVYQHGAIKKLAPDGTVYWEGWDNKKAAENVKVAREMLPFLEGKTLREITASKHKARFIRILSEVRDPSAYPIVTPDGRTGALQVNNDKVTLSKVAWGGYNTIEKAIAIMSATPENEQKVISDSLGDQHKVRSFYNNIVDPANESGHVTMDTHAIAAIHWMPYSGSSLEVIQNFGGGGVKNDGIAGIKGTYAANAEAYRRAGIEFNLLPREVQSITWEAVRLLFPKEFKTKNNVDKVRAVWNKFLHGEIDIKTARAEIFALATTSKDFPKGKDIGSAIADGEGLGDTAWAAEMGVGVDNSQGFQNADDSGAIPERGGSRGMAGRGNYGRSATASGGRASAAMVRPASVNGRGVAESDSEAGLASPPGGEPAVTPAQDAEYMAAVEAGDMEKAQRMVDEAAKAAGYDVGPVWHGSPDFIGTEFSPDMRGRRGLSRGGFSFTRDKSVAQSYMESGVNPFQRLVDDSNDLMRELQKRIDFGLNWKGPWEETEAPEFRTDALDSLESFQDYLSELGKTMPKDLAAIAAELSKRQNSGSFQANPKLIRAFLRNPQITKVAGKELLLAENPSQIKSADPVTYDENGNVIPLSQRFNPVKESSFYNPPADVPAVTSAQNAEYDEVMAKYKRQPSTEITAQKRTYSPIIRDLLERRKNGEQISDAVIARAIKEHFPSYRVKVPKSMDDLPSQRTVMDAITQDKKDAHQEAMQKGFPKTGSKITVRQDVPAMTQHGVGVVTTRTENGTFYLPAVRFTEPDFVKNELQSIKIALGGAKGPHIVINGKWSQDQTMPKDLENWTQVGFNPDRHSYYYERGTDRPVIGGKEAYQVGNTVYVKDAVFGEYAGNLYNPASESDEAEAADYEEAANETVNEEADVQETSDMMDQLRKDAEAADALRNDPEAVAAVQASGAMSGRNLSQQFRDPAAREFYRALTAARDMVGGPATVVFAKMRKWAAQQVQADPDKAIAFASELADDRAMMRPEEQAVVGAVIEHLNRVVAMTGNKATRLLLHRIANYYLDIGTLTAQTLAGRRDPLETPQDRWNKALTVIFGPDSKVRRRLALAPTAAAKARRIAELEAQIAGYQEGRQADIEAALTEARGQETQEEILERSDAANEKLKAQILKRVGIMEQDMTLSTVDRYSLQTAILELPAVREALDRYENGRDIMRLAFQGRSDSHIAGALQMNEADVAKFIQDVRNGIIRPALVEEVKSGNSWGEMIRAGFDSLARKVGLRMASVTGPLGTMAPPLTQQEQQDIENEVNRILNYALQPANRRNKAGSLIAKVIDTPGGRKVRVFVPFDPEDMASFYAVAREFSAAKASLTDKVYEYWINWPLLSGPQTQVANISGNAANVLWHYTAQRMVEAAMNVLYRDPKSAKLGEFKHVAKAFIGSIMPSLDMARQSFLTEGDSVRHKYLGEPMEIEFKDTDLDKVGGFRPSIGGKAGKLARLPGRLLRFTDAFFKTSILHMEATTIAYRAAAYQAKQQGLTGRNRDAFIESSMANALANPGSQIWQEANKTAEELLFQDDNAATDFVDSILGGSRKSDDLAKKMAEAQAAGDYETASNLRNRIFWRKVWHKITRIIFPFQRTPTNIIKVGLRKAGGSAVVGLWHAARAGLFKIKDGEAFVKNYTKAMQIKDVSESLLAGLGWMMLASMFEGDDDDEKKPILIVGNRPYAPGAQGEREAFLRSTGGANSILFRDNDGKVITSFNFSRYEPVATLLSAWVDGYRNYMEVNRRRKQGEPDASYMRYIGSSLLASVEGKSFLQGFSGMMETIRDFEERRDPTTSNWASKQLINYVVPNLIKQPLRNWDDLIRDTKTAGFGYAALPNPEIAPKLPEFAAEPKITATGERIRKSYIPAARLLFQANAVVKPQPDALLLRANRLNPAASWYPQPLQADDYYVREPGAKRGTPGYKKAIEDAAAKRRFAELDGKLYADAARRVTATATPAELAKPNEALIEKFKKAREQARAQARLMGGRIGLQKTQSQPITTYNK